jgi:hypothetical protein
MLAAVAAVQKILDTQGLVEWVVVVLVELARGLLEPLTQAVAVAVAHIT